MSSLLTVRMTRPNSGVVWGFRLYGGAEYGIPIVIPKIMTNSVAERAGLRVNDRIIAINQINAENMTHEQAKMEIIRTGNDITFVVMRPEGDQPFEPLPPQEVPNYPCNYVNPSPPAPTIPVNIVSHQVQRTQPPQQVARVPSPQAPVKAPSPQHQPASQPWLQSRKPQLNPPQVRTPEKSLPPLAPRYRRNQQVVQPMFVMPERIPWSALSSHTLPPLELKLREMQKITRPKSMGDLQIEQLSYQQTVSPSYNSYSNNQPISEHTNVLRDHYNTNAIRHVDAPKSMSDLQIEQIKYQKPVSPSYNPYPNIQPIPQHTIVVPDHYYADAIQHVEAPKSLEPNAFDSKPNEPTPPRTKPRRRQRQNDSSTTQQSLKNQLNSEPPNIAEKQVEQKELKIEGKVIENVAEQTKQNETVHSATEVISENENKDVQEISAEVTLNTQQTKDEVQDQTDTITVEQTEPTETQKEETITTDITLNENTETKSITYQTSDATIEAVVETIESSSDVGSSEAPTEIKEGLNDSVNDEENVVIDVEISLKENSDSNSTDNPATDVSVKEDVKKLEEDDKSNETIIETKEEFKDSVAMEETVVLDVEFSIEESYSKTEDHEETLPEAEQKSQQNSKDMKSVDESLVVEFEAIVQESLEEIREKTESDVNVKEAEDKIIDDANELEDDKVTNESDTKDDDEKKCSEKSTEEDKETTLLDTKADEEKSRENNTEEGGEK